MEEYAIKGAFFIYFMQKCACLQVRNQIVGVVVWLGKGDILNPHLSLYDIFYYFCSNVYWFAGRMENLIINRLKQGDERAFKYVYDHHYVFLCRFAFQLLKDSSLAEEVVDDVIFYLWEHRSEIEILKDLRAYLIRAVRNRCLNELNSRVARNEINISSFAFLEELDLLNAVFVDKKHPLGVLLEQEMEDELLRCIQKLPKECRSVFVKSRFEQKSYKEIASELNISLNTVKYHIKNALSILREHFAGYLGLFILLLLVAS